MQSRAARQEAGLGPGAVRGAAWKRARPRHRERRTAEPAPTQPRAGPSAPQLRARGVFTWDQEHVLPGARRVPAVHARGHGCARLPRPGTRRPQLGT